MLNYKPTIFINTQKIQKKYLKIQERKKINNFKDKPTKTVIIFLLTFFSIILTVLAISWLIPVNEQTNQSVIPILLLVAFIFAIISALRTK